MQLYFFGIKDPEEKKKPGDLIKGYKKSDIENV